MSKRAVEGLKTRHYWKWKDKKEYSCPGPGLDLVIMVKNIGTGRRYGDIVLDDKTVKNIFEDEYIGSIYIVDNDTELCYTIAECLNKKLPRYVTKEYKRDIMKEIYRTYMTDLYTAIDIIENKTFFPKAGWYDNKINKYIIQGALFVLDTLSRMNCEYEVTMYYIKK